MIKSQLVQIITDKKPGLYQRDVERIVNTIFNKIINSLAEGNRVELRGFGAFSVKTQKPRIARNPKTGEKIAVKEKKVPFFKTGKDLRRRLNNNN